VSAFVSLRNDTAWPEELSGMNDTNEPSSTMAVARALAGELGGALEQAMATVRAENIANQRARDDRLGAQVEQMTRRLDSIDERFEHQSRNSFGQLSRDFSPLLLTALGLLIVSLIGALCWELAWTKAYAAGQSSGYVDAARYERDHPSQWHAYQRRIASGKPLR
jgi:hypothetical protein